MEIGRKAVVSGVASRQDVQVAANGVNLDRAGEVVAAIPQQNSESVRTKNHPLPTANATLESPSHLTPQVKGHMDISLHNLGDYT